MLLLLGPYNIVTVEAIEFNSGISELYRYDACGLEILFLFTLLLVPLQTGSPLTGLAMPWNEIPLQIRMSSTITTLIHKLKVSADPLETTNTYS